MITYYEACKKAYDYFDKERSVQGLTDALECDNGWIFYARLKNTVQRGGPVIYIEKATGELNNICKITIENIKLKQSGVAITIPDEFFRKLQD